MCKAVVDAKQAMKSLLRKVFSPIITPLESGDKEYHYRSSHRQILLVVGALFLLLAAGSCYAAISAGELAGILPAVVFFLLGSVCEVVALLGNDRAVAKIWKADK